MIMTFLEIMPNVVKHSKKRKSNARISNEIDKNNINLIYESHHPGYWRKVEERLIKLRKVKNYLVVTEELTFSNF